jgi:hypothetical protein
LGALTVQPVVGTFCQTTPVPVAAVMGSHIPGLTTGGGGPLCFAFALGLGFALGFVFAFACTLGLVFTLALDFGFAFVFVFAFAFAFTFAFFLAMPVLLSGFVENARCRSGIADLS